MRGMEPPRLMFLIVMFMFFYLSPDPSQSTPSQRREHGNKVVEARKALAGMMNATYGQFNPKQRQFSNLTGFRDGDGYLWNLLPNVKEAARNQLLSIQQMYGDKRQSKSYEDARMIRMPLYQNISGTVQGNFVKAAGLSATPHINLTALVPNNDYVTHEFLQNVTEKEGEIKIRFEEDNLSLWDHELPLASAIVVDMTLFTSSSPGSGWDIRLHGVHLHESGVVVVSTTSQKFGGIFALPHFALAKEDFYLSRRMLNMSITQGLERWEQNIDGPNVSPWTANAFDGGGSLFPTPSCEFIVYLQQHPLYLSKTGDDTGLMRQIEQEMRFPQGAPLPTPPLMTMSATIFSPDCGFVLQSRGLPDSHESPNHLSGPRKEMFWGLTRNLVLALSIVLGIQIALIKRQVDEASTPSTRSRISYQTIGLMAMGDALMISALIGFLMISQAVFLLIAAATFLCFFNIAIMEMRFIFDIWTVQVGDLLQRMRERERQLAQAAARQATTQRPTSNATATANGTTAADPPTSQAPRPVDSGATPIIITPDQEVEMAAEEDERLLPTTNPTATTATTATVPAQPSRIGSDFGTIYARFYFTILGIVLISIWAYSWPKQLRSAYVNTLTFLYLSFWVPQIYRNTMRNCRKALRWEYVFGISICRLVPIIYCYAKERNTFSFDINPSGALFFVGWVWFQVLILLSQQFLGPRLLVKDSWCPPAYDYHPILRDDLDDPESGTTLPIGFVASASEAKESDSRDKNKHAKVFDCAICMQEIEVLVVSKNEGEGRGASWLGRMNYMVTPCRHIFHSQCLEGWMRLRLVCPICREALPPI